MIEPRTFNDTATFGDFNLKFTGEQYSGNPILDTKVELNGETLCWITWEERKEFARKLDDVLSEYRI